MEANQDMKNLVKILRGHDRSHDAVILVHGTWSSRAGDGREKNWWEPSSDFIDALHRRVGNFARCDTNEFLFQWSGENSQSQRSLAAMKLLELIIYLDHMDVGYHLIGHSHGGNVIWTMLQGASEVHGELRNLRSWCTVGTPFLHARYSELVPQRKIYLEKWLGIWSEHDEVISALIRASKFSQRIVPRDTSYTRLRSLMLKESLKDENSLNVISYILNRNPVDKNILSEDSSALESMRAFILLRQRVFRSARRWYLCLALLSFPLFLLQRLLAPIGDRIVISQLRKSIFGSDLVGNGIDQVSLGPFAVSESYEKLAFPPLPESISCQIIRRANESIKRIVPTLRDSLALPLISSCPASFQESIDKIRDTISCKELVHTSYFEDEKIRDLCGAPH